MSRRKRISWAAAAMLPLALGAGFSAYSMSAPDPCDELSLHWRDLDPQAELAQRTKELGQAQGAVAKDTFSQVVRDINRYVQRGSRAHVAACKAAMGDSKIGAAGFAAQSSCYLAATDAVKSYIQRLAVAGPKELRPELWLSARLPSLSSCAQIQPRQNEASSKARRDQVEKELAQAQVDTAFFDHDKAQAHAQQAIELASSMEDQRLECRGWLVSAKALDGQGRYEPARKAADRAYRLAEQVNDAGLRLESAVTRALVMKHQGHPHESSSQLRDVYPLAKRGDIGTERRLSYFAVACRAPRASFRLCEAHRNCVEGLALMEHEPSSVPTRNHMFRRLAWLYFEAGLVEKGLEVSSRALKELRDAVGADSRLMLASELLHLTLAGEHLRTQGKDPKAIEALLPTARRVHSSYVQTYGDTSTRVINARTNLAELLRWAGHLDEAAPLFQALLRDHPEDPGRYYTLVAYGQLQLAKGQKKQGIETLRQGLALIEATRSRSKHSGQQTRIPEQAEALFALAKIQDNAQEGLAMAKRALSVYQSLKSTADEERAQHECAELGQGLESYGRERQAVQAWIDARSN